jgi:UrcA family protein
MNTRSFTAGALALAATGLALTPVAHAAEDYRTVGVTHTDLDLSSEEGKAELERRIDRAAKEACGIGEAQVGTLIRTREQRTCYRQAKRQFDNHFARIIEDAQRGG